MAVILSFEFKYKNTLEGTLVYPYTDAAPGQTAIVSKIHGTNTKRFATKICDVRWSARRFMRMVHRRGVPCFYYEAFYHRPDGFDEFTGSLKMSGVVAEQTYAAGTSEQEANREIGYMSPRLIKCLQPNYESQVVTGEQGNIYEEEANISVPAYWIFHRWDLLKIQDKNWVVTQEPKIIYDNRGYVEGFELVCKSLRPNIIDF